ncbi:family 78 glycoside hydrolase catalytic domain [Herbiconiux sp. VKM Ac-2851]|uniref:family 78 glycoside hydrolase catalytic domain n=1 Tax=Herbiconiux sp. VKM Ac-2851 TaxID=2739025 RepID=UPI00156765ED|nr:family 78 glycoside hydrolase catalytic domain [Herbiconiux sp. VKM Ac-2851]NQX35129.1 family 78 glycoside hydrolase catalytic domain [Herbiconiux sp. VKM Ac-2851]
MSRGDDAPRGLRADGLVDPIGGTRAAPRLSWRLGTAVSSAEVRVIGAASLAAVVRGEGDLFDRTTGEPSLDWPIEPLASRERVWWAAGAVDGTGRPTWSEPAFVEAPLWLTEDWTARPVTHRHWKAPAAPAPPLPELRTRFEVPHDAVSARLYLTGSGVILPELNGVKAIAGELEPGYSELRTTTLASAWDVTPFLLSGDNTLVLRLMSGIAFLPRGQRYTKFERVGEPVWAAAQLEIETAGGERMTVATGDDWQARLGPVVESHWYGGESRVEGLAEEWEAVVRVEVPSRPRWRSAPAVQVVDSLQAVPLGPGAGGRRIFDLGVNAAGRPRLRLKHARAGEPVVLRPAELLDDDGRIDQSTTGSPIWDSITPAGQTVDWTPDGVYHGARYVEISGLDLAESDDVLNFEVLRAADERVGSFETSDPFLARLHTIIDRAVQSNMSSVFTDCPHREKLGWLEQLHYCFPVLARGYDVQAHLEDMVRHMIDAQTDDGLVPNIAPELVVFGELAVKGDIDAFRSDPNWGRAVIEVPWQLYRHYGDSRILAESFPAAQRYLAYLRGRSEVDLIDFGLGDWIEIDDGTPRGLVATHGWACALETASLSAEVLGEAAESHALRSEADGVREALRGRFLDAVSGVWGSGSQASWALGWDVARASGDHDGAERALVGLLAAVHDAGDAFTVGENSLPYLIRALVESGHDTLLDALIRRTDAPGYGYQIAAGSTSLTESWKGALGDTGVISQNHFMLGVIDDWLTGDVAGLRQADDSVGWQKVRVRPRPLPGVDDALTVFDSPRGRMEAGWRRGADGVVEVWAVAPAGVEVEVVLPPGARLRA